GSPYTGIGDVWGTARYTIAVCGELCKALAKCNCRVQIGVATFQCDRGVIKTPKSRIEPSAKRYINISIVCDFPRVARKIAHKKIGKYRVKHAFSSHV